MNIYKYLAVFLASSIQPSNWDMTLALALELGPEHNALILAVEPADARIEIEGQGPYQPGMRQPAGHLSVTASLESHESQQNSVDLSTDSVSGQIELRTSIPNPGETYRDCAGCPEMMVVPAGRFRMGDLGGGGNKSELPVHDVSVQLFAIGKREVMVREFKEFVSTSTYLTNAGKDRSSDVGCFSYDDRGNRRESNWKIRAGVNWQNPGYATVDNSYDPVACVSWNDAQAYVKWLSSETGKQYRLPSEAEQEYVLRAGGVSRYPWGDKKSEACLHSNVADLTRSPGRQNWEVQFKCNDGYFFAAPTGGYSPNAFGLMDISGNLWEWAEDCWHPTYSGAPDDGSAWTLGGNCNRRMIRGGSWAGSAPFLRSAFRGVANPSSRYDYTGFRVAQSLAPSNQAAKNQGH